MNYTQKLTGSENLYLHGVPELSLQACDDGLWMHFTTLDGKRHCSINLPVRFAKGTYLYDSVVCQWSEEYRKAISKMSPALIGETQPETAGRTQAGVAPTTNRSDEIALICDKLEYINNRLL